MSGCTYEEFLSYFVLELWFGLWHVMEKPEVRELGWPLSLFLLDKESFSILIEFFLEKVILISLSVIYLGTLDRLWRVAIFSELLKQDIIGFEIRGSDDTLSWLDVVRGL